jgi:hypothetical protein
MQFFPDYRITLTSHLNHAQLSRNRSSQKMVHLTDCTSLTQYIMIHLSPRQKTPRTRWWLWSKTFRDYECDIKLVEDFETVVHMLRSYFGFFKLVHTYESTLRFFSYDRCFLNFEYAGRGLRLTDHTFSDGTKDYEHVHTIHECKHNFVSLSIFWSGMITICRWPYSKSLMHLVVLDGPRMSSRKFPPRSLCHLDSCN